ncbi:hypothetical protein M2302_003076 [Micromonospora sp. A200]|nr:hypothetical protein [Micromonospora sp. A200]
MGALHEVDGKLFLGPPKTSDSVRRIRLPAFLVNLLATGLAEHHHPIVSSAHAANTNADPTSTAGLASDRAAAR